MSRPRFFTPEYNFLRLGYWLGEVDARPMGLFRIFLAGLLLKNAIYLMFVADEFYSETGVLPREALWNLAPDDRFSLMDAMPYTWMIQIFFMLWILVLVCLLVGYKTRLMSILNFIILISVHERNVLILNGADSAMRAFSFWGMFIPLGKAYAVDSVLQRWQTFRLTRNTADLQAAPPKIFAFSVRMLQMQVAVIYVVTFIFKLEGKPWLDGTALYYALQIESLTLPSGTWLVDHAPFWFFKVGTYFALVMEGGFAFFVFLPFFQPYLRGFGLLLGVILHLGIAVLMSIHDFSLVMLIGYLTLLDTRWVDALENSLHLKSPPLLIPPPKPTDSIWLLLAMVGSPAIHFTDDPAIKQENNLALWSRISKQSLLGRLGKIWNPFLRSFLSYLSAFEIISPQISTEPTPLKTQVNYPGRVLLVLYLALIMGIVISVNRNNILNGIGNPPPARPIVRYLGLRQTWAMFAPNPSDIDGWMSVLGHFPDGTELDLMTGKSFSQQMTQYYWGPQVRWKRYTSEIWKSEAYLLLKPLGNYFCLQYPDVETLEISYHWRWPHRPGKQANTLTQTQLSHYTCP